MSGDKEELSETLQFKRFRTEMIMIMFVAIMLILLDRFFYISNTFDHIQEQKSDDSVDKLEKIESCINSQDKHNLIKLAIYEFMVFVMHALWIWYFPIAGNYKKMSKYNVMIMVHETIYLKINFYEDSTVFDVV